LRDVARAASVCLMTASLSLRHSPKISAATRERVRAIAAQLGYRPDPEISRLMGRLRHSRKTRGGEVIGILDVHRLPETAPHPYMVSIRRGIAARADALGFGVTLLRAIDYNGNLRQLIRVVRHRGITGLIILPVSEGSTSLDPVVNWEGLSVVSATTSVLAPRFHQVVPNQLYNMMTLIERVQLKGFRRLGAIIGETLEQRTAHQYSLALTWHGHRERILTLPGTTGARENEARVIAWLRAQRPDVVLAQDADVVAGLIGAARLRREVALVSLSGRTDNRVPYQDQLPELIGDTAVRLVTGMMHNHETGVPEHPQITTIDGVFRDVSAK
jgi:DNA-binding LacI/PurR family transcriptional regulator